MHNDITSATTTQLMDSGLELKGPQENIIHIRASLIELYLILDILLIQLTKLDMGGPFAQGAFGSCTGEYIMEKIPFDGAAICARGYDAGHAGNHMQKVAHKGTCITASVMPNIYTVFLNTRLLFIVLTIYCFIFSNSNHVNGTEAYLDLSYNDMTKFFGKKNIAKIQEDDMPYVSQDEKQEIIADFFEDLLNPAGALSAFDTFLAFSLGGSATLGFGRRCSLINLICSTVFGYQANGGNCLVSWDKVQIPYLGIIRFSQNPGAYRGFLCFWGVVFECIIWFLFGNPILPWKNGVPKLDLN
ncbi:hypothetical protein ACJX0J_022747 [Zea mays]